MQYALQLLLYRATYHVFKEIRAMQPTNHIAVFWIGRF